MDIDDLKSSIKMDMERSGSYDRYPTRFFAIPFDEKTADRVLEISKYILEQCDGKKVEIIDFRDWLQNEDGWVTMQTVEANIRSLDENTNFIVVGFSEYARFLSNAELQTMIISLLEIENTGKNIKRRIYFACFALYSQIEKEIIEHHRRFDVYNPILNEIVVEDLPIIYFIDDGIDSYSYDNIIYTSNEWYGMWRNKEIHIAEPILCFSKTLSYFYEKASPDNVYNIRKIANYEDLLKYLYKIDCIKAYEPNVTEFFKKLIKILRYKTNHTLFDAILQELNCIEITDKNFVSLWVNNETFKRWLLQNYVLLKNLSNSYMYNVANELNELNDSEFFETTYSYIFQHNNKEYYTERRSMLLNIIELQPKANFGLRMTNYYEQYLMKKISEKSKTEIDKIDFGIDITLDSGKELIAYDVKKELLPIVTPFSEYERQLLLWLYREGLVAEEDILKIYLDFAIYLNNDTPVLTKNFTKLTKYFENYRKYRSDSELSSGYDHQLTQWNSTEERFYQWYTDTLLEYPESILKKEKFKGKVFVLDGVGAEYTSFIATVLKEEGYIVDLCLYAKSHLPSITSQAKKYFHNDYLWIDDYDKKVVHGEIYNSVINLEHSLSQIKEVIKSVADKNRGEAIAIIADHGSTANNRFYKKSKKYNFEFADHGGRCYLNKEGVSVPESDDYIQYSDEDGNQWLVALNEQSLYNNVPYAVHGGATPEEVIVPVIVSHFYNGHEFSYRIVAKNLQVKGTDRTVEFKITPNPDTATMTGADGTNTSLKYCIDTNSWKGSLLRGIEQLITVSVGKQSCQFTTVPTTKMKGDDGFDD